MQADSCQDSPSVHPQQKLPLRFGSLEIHVSLDKSPQDKTFFISSPEVGVILNFPQEAEGKMHILEHVANCGVVPSATARWRHDE